MFYSKSWREINANNSFRILYNGKSLFLNRISAFFNSGIEMSNANDKDLLEAQEYSINRVECPHCSYVMESEGSFSYNTIKCEDCEEEFYVR